MKRLLAFASLCLLSASLLSQAKTDKLRVYFIDVEGGQSTLFVTPKGESLLIDTGWPDHDFRDADRIAAAAKNAGITKIDYVLITHFHDDHVGGVPQLVQRIPVGAFIDHGINRETENAGVVGRYEAYHKVLRDGHYKHIIAKPGDVLPLTGLYAKVISADGNLLQTALPGEGAPNPFCAKSEPRAEDKTENSRSLGVRITFGKLKLLDLGDLTSDKEIQLMCPKNPIGTVDVYIVSHHGWYQSSSPALVHAIHPRVAIMDNGETKGGSTPTLDTIRSSPGLEDLWQLHYSAEGSEAHNTSAANIANLTGTDAGNDIELIGNRDGSFDVINARTNATKHYPAR
jgi:competence protein ComEC